MKKIDFFSQMKWKFVSHNKRGRGRLSGISDVVETSPNFFKLFWQKLHVAPFLHLFLDLTPPCEGETIAQNDWLSNIQKIHLSPML